MNPYGSSSWTTAFGSTPQGRNTVTGTIMSPSHQVQFEVNELGEKLVPIVQQRVFNNIRNEMTTDERVAKNCWKNDVDKFWTAYFKTQGVQRSFLNLILNVRDVVSNNSLVKIAEDLPFANFNGILILVLDILDQIEKENVICDDLYEWRLKLKEAMGLKGANQWETIKARVNVYDDFYSKYTAEVEWADQAFWLISETTDMILTTI